MIKLMGNKTGHLPVQLAGGGASGSGTNVKATFVKTSGDQVNLCVCLYLPDCDILGRSYARESSCFNEVKGCDQRLFLSFAVNVMHV